MKDLPQASTKKKSCYEIEAIVSFDERGQLVLPKDLRKKFDLKAGEKFLLVSCTNDDGLCCFSMIKTDAVNSIVGQSIGPMMNCS